MHCTCKNITERKRELWDFLDFFFFFLSVMATVTLYNTNCNMMNFCLL